MYHSEVIYHVYNQSINYENLYRSDGDYRLFLGKVREFICPSADILAYCLMPDHFHFMVKPTAYGCSLSRSKRYLRDEEDIGKDAFQQNLSHGFKTLLSSYTQKVNPRWRRRGSLFKAKTKAKPGYADFYPDAEALEGNEPFTLLVPYLRICFDYIHNNPVKANFVNHPEEWEFSSAMDYLGYRDSEVCNYKLTERLLGMRRVIRYRSPYPRPTDL